MFHGQDFQDHYCPDCSPGFGRKCHVELGRAAQLLHTHIQALFRPRTAAGYFDPNTMLLLAPWPLCLPVTPPVSHLPPKWRSISRLSFRIKIVANWWPQRATGHWLMRGRGQADTSTRGSSKWSYNTFNVHFTRRRFRVSVHCTGAQWCKVVIISICNLYLHSERQFSIETLFWLRKQPNKS